MTHTYQLTGMTCSSCEAKVKSSLHMVENVTNAEVSKNDNTATITMDKHITIDKLQDALGGKESKYQIAALQHNEALEQSKSWFNTYKPILLIFSYILGLSFLIQYNNLHFDVMQFMRHFMAGFFLVFSFFKLLNLKGFAESYVMYDVIAKKYLYGLICMPLLN